MKRQLLCSFAMLGLLAGSSFALVQSEFDQAASETRNHTPYEMNSRNNDCATAIDVFAAGMPFDAFYPAVGPTGQWFYLSPQAEDYTLCMSSCHPESFFAGDSNIAIATGTDCNDAAFFFDEDAPHAPCYGNDGSGYPSWYASIDYSDLIFAANTPYWVVFYDYDGIGGDLRVTADFCEAPEFSCPPNASIPVEPSVCGDFGNALDCGSLYCGELADGSDTDHYWMTVPELGGDVGGAFVELNVYGDDTPGQAAFGFGLDPTITVYAMDDFTCSVVYASDDDSGQGFDAYLGMEILTPGIYLVEVGGYGPGPYLLTMDCFVNCWEDNSPTNPDLLITDADYMNYIGEENAMVIDVNLCDYCNLQEVTCFSSGFCLPAASDAGEYWFRAYTPTLADNCYQLVIFTAPEHNQTCGPIISLANSGTNLGWFATDAFTGIWPTTAWQEPGTELSTFSIDAQSSCCDEVTVTLYYDWFCDPVEADELPVSFALAQNHPNPFNPTTTIEFSLAEASNANLSVFNMAGEKVATLVNGLTERGSHNVTFDASNLSSGVYFYSLEANGMTETKKMVLMK